MEKIEIKSLKLTLGKREIELTPEEARKLHEALGKLFGEKLVRHEHHYDRWYWQPIATWASSGTTVTNVPPNQLDVTCTTAGYIHASL